MSDAIQEHDNKHDNNSNKIESSSQTDQFEPASTRGCKGLYFSRLGSRWTAQDDIDLQRRLSRTEQKRRALQLQVAKFVDKHPNRDRIDTDEVCIIVEQTGVEDLDRVIDVHLRHASLVDAILELTP